MSGPLRTPKTITSLQNERVKLIRSLEMRKARKETGLYVAEGASVLISAREAGVVPAMLVTRAVGCISPERSEGRNAPAVGGGARGGALRAGALTHPTSGLIAWALAAGAEVLEVSEAVLGKIAAKDNPQALIGVFRSAFAEPPQSRDVPASVTWLALEEVRDPGNLGTIIRTVHAVGAAGVILVGTCCDPFARECVRATMGSLFAVPLVRMSREAFLVWRKDWPGEMVGTHLSASEDFRKAAYRAPVLLAMGGEGPGLSAELTAACDRLVKIPMVGRLDSLNLAVATALTLYQIRGEALAL